MKHGLVHIRYSDKRLLQLILSEINSSTQKLTCWGDGAVKRTSL